MSVSMSLYAVTQGCMRRPVGGLGVQCQGCAEVAVWCDTSGDGSGPLTKDELAKVAQEKVPWRTEQQTW